jgi:hypothetical protein
VKQVDDYRVFDGATMQDFKQLTKEHRMPHAHRKTLINVFFWLSGAQLWQQWGDEVNVKSNMQIANIYLNLASMKRLEGTTPEEMYKSLLARLETYPLRKEKIAS